MYDERMLKIKDTIEVCERKVKFPWQEWIDIDILSHSIYAFDIFEYYVVTYFKHTVEKISKRIAEKCNIVESIEISERAQNMWRAILNRVNKLINNNETLDKFDKGNYVYSIDVINSLIYDILGELADKEK